VTTPCHLSSTAFFTGPALISDLLCKTRERPFNNGPRTSPMGSIVDSTYSTPASEPASYSFVDFFDPATRTRKGLCPVTVIRHQDQDPLQSHSLYFEQHGSGPIKVLFIMGYACPLVFHADRRLRTAIEGLIVACLLGKPKLIISDVMVTILQWCLIIEVWVIARFQRDHIRASLELVVVIGYADKSRFQHEWHG
jgi:hypothetical protein